MNKELKRSNKEKPKPIVSKAFKKPKIRKVITANLALIEKIGFHFNIQQKKNEFFTTSLYEVDRLTEEKDSQDQEQEPQETKEKMLKRTVPKAYHDLIQVFSKTESNKLPSYRPYDHKIKLTKGVPLGYHPLYHQTVNELCTLKGYLIDNLNKGFIKHSSVLFALLILFVKKLSRELHFCIDY